MRVCASCNSSFQTAMKRPEFYTWKYLGVSKISLCALSRHKNPELMLLVPY